ncbi:hypothetical protein L3D22_08135 [Lysobacter soli]|uniref:hypothetical protein n=1 Tax=Lysobacter soli TaxID=453783 RepID=UPI00209F0693|nr:hypothetical protein [Lysobacter soli]UTA55748.1 hypothetical protein L3D22_08135 [Lysobacter soli]
MTALTVIPAKAGIHLDVAFAVAVALALAPALARHSREGGNPGTFHAFPATRKSKEESLSKLPIACGARVTFLCLPKEK